MIRKIKKLLVFSHGQSLVELLVVIGLSSILLPAILTGFYATRNGRAQQDQRLHALSYLHEAQEALSVVEANSWTQVVNGTYHPVVSGNTWTLVSGQESLIGSNFTRKIVIEDVFRDAGGDIVSSGGTLDPSTKLATSTVLWNTPIVSQVSQISYLTRHTNRLSTDTTIPNFSGTYQGATYSATTGTSIPNDGQVQLGAGGKGEWCSPNLSIAALDLPKNGVANALSAVPGQVVAGTGENASGISFANIAVSNTDPPTSSISGTFDNYKTNGVFNDSNYAYIATDNHSKEMIILDLNQRNPVTGKYTEVGYFDAPGNYSGKSVYVSGTIGFLTVNNILYTINLSSKSGSRPQLASRTLAGDGTKVAVNGSYAFISIAGASQELQIVQFNASGTTLTITGSADINGQAAYDVTVNSTGTRAYLATGADASKSEFFIIDTSSKSGSRPTRGSYNASGMDPNAVAVVTNNKAILVGTGAEEYQVIDITDETRPVRCGGLNVDSGINGLASVLEGDGDAYTYIITGDSSGELKIIEGGPGGQFATSGTYISPIFDAGNDVYFNSFTVNHAVPSSASMQYEVAVANAVNNSCSGAIFSYAGPYATSSALPATTGNPSYQNPGRCLRYKATLSTTDITQSPILFDFTINYSP